MRIPLKPGKEKTFTDTIMAYSALQLGPKYIRYQLSAANAKGHGIHSPFIFELVTKVFQDKTRYPDYAAVELLRRELQQSGALIPTVDFGAGSGSSKAGGTERPLSAIARTALKPSKFGQLFYRLAKYYCPSTILELGTSLGVTTAYLAKGNPDAQVVTMEGAPAIAALARQHFRQLEIQNIQVVEGNFDQTLTGVLQPLKRLDLAYVDGNHRLEPTLRYYMQMKPWIHADSILIFDDIHWSPDMEQAWETLKRDPMVRCSVDLFYIGILFFRTEFMHAQHFSIRF
jgi:predicted O-methyltransferase YrrM